MTTFIPGLTPGLTPSVTVLEDSRDAWGQAARAQIAARCAAIRAAQRAKWDAIPSAAQARLDYLEEQDNALKGIFDYDRDPVARAFEARYERSEEDEDPEYLRADRGALRGAVKAAATDGESDEVIDRRMAALVALVAQLGVAWCAGSTITVPAVINVARAAFPRVWEYSDDDISRTIEIAVAGMLVMRNLQPDWYSEHRAQFGEGVRQAWDYSHAFRPDAFRGLA